MSFGCTSVYSGTVYPTELVIFQTDGAAAGTQPISTIDMAALGYSGTFANAHLSPDDSMIVFEGGTTNSTGLLSAGTYVVASNGESAPVLLAPDTDSDHDVLGNPRFTPDGTEILYSQGGTVWIMNADGSNPQQLLTIASENAEFSPSMTTLYYQTTGGVYVANADGSDPVSIAGSAYSFLGLSPNGQSMLLSSPSGIFTATSMGGSLQQLNVSTWADW
ncbi:MAG TPA: hypothetical protein VEN79_04145 [Terriglobia bacterium]|nr:hypothetical protein [Terriglobia bacterium]